MGFYVAQKQLVARSMGQLRHNMIYVIVYLFNSCYHIHRDFIILANDFTLSRFAHCSKANTLTHSSQRGPRVSQKEDFYDT